MPPAIIDVQKADDRRDVVHRAVQALAEGQVVALPTDTSYALAASALSATAISRLGEIQADPNGVVLALRSAEEALDFIPDMSSVGRRIVRRGWPGPLTLQFVVEHPDSLFHRLPEAVRQRVAPENILNLRVPDYPLLREVQQMLIGPVVLTPVGAAQAEAVSADQTVAAVANEVPLVFDDGECRFGQSPTWIHVNQQGFQLLQEGVVAEAVLQRLASMVIIFVCTGNTCRSPMAEMLCRQMIASKVGCSVEDLEKRGIIVLSAGVSAYSGGRASPEAVEVLRQKDLNLADHCSQPLTEDMIQQADQILCMTNAHRQMILAQFPEVSDRVRLLCHGGGDVSDPIGGPIEQYQACAEQIEKELTHWIEKWEF